MSENCFTVSEKVRDFFLFQPTGGNPEQANCNIESASFARVRYSGTQLFQPSWVMFRLARLLPFFISEKVKVHSML